MKILLFLSNDEGTCSKAVRTCWKTVRDLLENGKGLAGKRYRDWLKDGIER
jgi:hypothetical protein